MPRRFNSTGVCNPKVHYMVDVSNKIEAITKLIEGGAYFTINRPRQYGKTTILLALEKELFKKGYIVISISFEGIDNSAYQSYEMFTTAFLDLIKDALEYNQIDICSFFEEDAKKVHNMLELSKFITSLIRLLNKKVVLMIDEVDKSSNNQLFLDFLGMLRNKYLLRVADKDKTFHSVILAGVHDVKTLKLKLRPDEEKKYNSPWNIASNFTLDLSFNPQEISTMLIDYSDDKGVSMDIPEISKALHYYTSGYPFLVSRLCEIIDTEIMCDSKWDINNVETAVKTLLKENNPNFDVLIKNLQNDTQLYEFISKIVLDGGILSYNIDNPIISLGVINGILREENGKIIVHNRIYEQRIYNYMASKQETETSMIHYNFYDNFIENDKLNMDKILLKFQQFMKENYSNRDEKFIEREGKLLFLAFIKPIINGRGFDFKEVQISEERRLDIVITYLDSRYIVELKIWRGQESHKKGLLQLNDYLNRVGIKKGYLIIFDFNKGKKDWTQKSEFMDGKEIFIIKV